MVTHTQSCSLKTNRYGKKLYAVKSHESGKEGLGSP